MRRLPLVLGAAVLVAATFTGVAHATGGSSCVTAAQTSYEHEFDGPGGTVTIASARPLCDGEEQAFSLVSYTGTGPWFVYDADSAWVGEGRRSVTLDVDVPACATRVEAIFGSGIGDEPATDAYGDHRLGSQAGVGKRSTGAATSGSDGGAGRSSNGLASYAGGDTECTPEPAVTFQSWCDGVLNTRLANAAGANVDAVFLVGGKRIHVRPGKHTDLVSRTTGPVEIRDNAFTTSTGSWTAPSTCTPAG